MYQQVIIYNQNLMGLLQQTIFHNHLYMIDVEANSYVKNLCNQLQLKWKVQCTVPLKNGIYVTRVALKKKQIEELQTFIPAFYDKLFILFGNEAQEKLDVFTRTVLEGLEDVPLNGIPEIQEK